MLMQVSATARSGGLALVTALELDAVTARDPGEMDNSGTSLAAAADLGRLRPASGGCHRAMLRVRTAVAVAARR
jgi:hypothetical protein